MTPERPQEWSETDIRLYEGRKEKVASERDDNRHPALILDHGSGEGTFVRGTAQSCAGTANARNAGGHGFFVVCALPKVLNDQTIPTEEYEVLHAGVIAKFSKSRV